MEIYLLLCLQAYTELISFEHTLDFFLMRKRLDIQDALRRPLTQKRKLRIFLSDTVWPGKDLAAEADQQQMMASWQLRVEGRLIDDDKGVKPSKVKRKFSSFFKSLVIKLDEVRHHSVILICAFPSF